VTLNVLEVMPGVFAVHIVQASCAIECTRSNAECVLCTL